MDATDSYAADMDREVDLQEQHREATQHYEDMAKSRPDLVNELVCEGLANACTDSRNMLLLTDPLEWAMWARDLLMREVQSWAAQRADEHIAGRRFEPDFVSEDEQ